MCIRDRGREAKESLCQLQKDKNRAEGEYQNAIRLNVAKCQELETKINQMNENIRCDEELIKRQSEDRIAETKGYLLMLLRTIQSSYNKILNLVQEGYPITKETCYDQIITEMNSDYDNKDIFLDKVNQMLQIMSDLEKIYGDGMSKISLLLLPSSKIYQNLDKVYTLGKCLIYSLCRSYRQIHLNTMRSVNEKNHILELKDLKRRMGLELSSLKDKDTIKTDEAEKHKTELLDIYKKLKGLQGERYSTLFLIDLEHTINYIRECAVPLIDIISGSEDSMADMTTLNSFDVYKGCRSFGETTQLKNSLSMKKECINTLGEGITLFALLEYAMKFELSESENNDTLKCLLNLSNLVDCFMEHLRKIAQSFQKHGSLREENELLNEVFQNTKEVFLIECTTDKLLEIDSFASKCLSQIVDYGIAVKKETYGAVTIQKKFDDLVRVMQTSRKNIDKKFDVQHKITSKISFYFSKAILNYKVDIAMVLVKDKINKNENFKAMQNQFSTSSLVLNFLELAAKQLAVKAVDLYEDPFVYPECTQKFENIVIASLETFDEAQKILGFDCYENNLITFVSNIDFLKNIKEGKIMGLQASLEELFSDQNHEVQLKEFKEKIEKWEKLAEKLKEDQHQLLIKHHREEMIRINRENESKRIKFDSEMKDFQKEREQFEMIAKKLFENILETYKHSNHSERTEVICSQFITVMDGLDSTLKFDWFQRDYFNIKYKVTIYLKEIKIYYKDIKYSGYFKCLIYREGQNISETKISIPSRNIIKDLFGFYKVKIDQRFTITTYTTDMDFTIKIMSPFDDPIFLHKINEKNIKLTETSETIDLWFSALNLSHYKEIIANLEHTKKNDNKRVTDICSLEERCNDLFRQLPKDLKPPVEKENSRPEMLKGTMHALEENPILSTMKEFNDFLELDKPFFIDLKDKDLKNVQSLEDILETIRKRMENIKRNSHKICEFHTTFSDYSQKSFAKESDVSLGFYDFLGSWKPLNKLWSAGQKEVFSDFRKLFELFKHNYEKMSLIELAIKQMCSLIQSLSFSNPSQIVPYIKLVRSIPKNIVPHVTIAETKNFLNKAEEECKSFSNSILKLKSLSLKKVTHFSSDKATQENSRPSEKLSSALKKRLIKLDLGFSLDGVPQCSKSLPYITFENCEEENVLFNFSLPMFCKISQAYGEIKPISR